MTSKFDDSNFEQEVLKSQKPVLVDFYTTTCGPCRKIAPIIDKLADELKDMVIGKADVMQTMENAKAYSISAVPTLILFKDGKEVKRTMGVISEADLRKFIEN